MDSGFPILPMGKVWSLDFLGIYIYVTPIGSCFTPVKPICLFISWVVPPPRIPVANEGLVGDSRAYKCNVILVVTIASWAGG